MTKLPNISGINYERAKETIRRKGFIVNLISVILTLLALVFVVFIIFNPVKIRPSVADYMKRFNQISADQKFKDRLTETTIDLSAGSVGFPLPNTGLKLELSYSKDGYLTGLTLVDDQSDQSGTSWLSLSPAELREMIFLTIDAIDPKWTMVSLYRTFDALGINLDQPLSQQTPGTRETAESGLTFKLTNDSRHFNLAVLLDVLQE